MKKVLCLLLALTLCVPVWASNGFEDLNRYGIMQGDPDGSLRLEDEVTRAEMTKMILASQNLGDYAATRRPTEFKDVSEAYWASGYIHTAWQQGIVVGKGDGLFEPEDPVTNEEAVKMLVALLGYDQKAESKGGFPYGYMRTADEIGLLGDLNLSGTKNALRGDIAALLQQALDIPLMKQTGFGAEVTYQVMSGESGIPLQTLRHNFDPPKKEEIVLVSDETGAFNGPEYTGRVLQITGLEKDEAGYRFRNGLNNTDTALYIIDADTKVHESVNTVGLDGIRNGQYAQVWYYTADQDEIELLKVELMKNKPSGI